MDKLKENVTNWKDLLILLQVKNDTPSTDYQPKTLLETATKKLLDDSLETWKNDVCQAIQQAKPKLIDQAKLLREGKNTHVEQGWNQLLAQLNSHCDVANEKFITELESGSSHLSESEKSSLQQAVLAIIPKTPLCQPKPWTIINLFVDCFLT